MAMSTSAGHTDPGTRYGPLNQDTFFCTERTIADESSSSEVAPGQCRCGAWGVFDGHGLLGEYASRIASSTIQLLLEMSLGQKPENIREELVSSFSTAHQNIMQSTHIAPLRYKFGNVATFVLSLLSPDSEEIIYVNESDPNDSRPLEFGTTAVTVFRRDADFIVANSGNSHAVVGRISSPSASASASASPPSLSSERLTTQHSIQNPQELSASLS